MLGPGAPEPRACNASHRAKFPRERSKQRHLRSKQMSHASIIAHQPPCAIWMWTVCTSAVGRELVRLRIGRQSPHRLAVGLTAHHRRCTLASSRTQLALVSHEVSGNELVIQSAVVHRALFSPATLHNMRDPPPQHSASYRAPVPTSIYVTGVVYFMSWIHEF